MSISEFGVQAYRESGVKATLCRPGINPNEFFPYPDTQKKALRQQLGVSEDAFILGTMAQNQGRKAITKMLEGFFQFAKDKPDALYLLDMDKVSPVGWNIPHVCQQRGWDVSKLIFREDCQAKGIHELRDRYNLLDAHVVLSHREGYGLPLTEAMACGVVSIAMDYCSGKEIVGDGKGLLIKPIDYANVSTWGGADDYFPDIDDFVKQMSEIYDSPAKRQLIAEKGMAWSRSQSWDMATDNVYNMLVNLKPKPQPEPVALPVVTPPTPRPDALKPDTMKVVNEPTFEGVI
jgi:glycosyltransferase involved in cell wall biosynthesis